MRQISGNHPNTRILVLDKPGHGGASHEYEVVCGEDESMLTRVSFQEGPVKEFGVNGCHNEDLLAIVIDRLQSFQDGSFACRENALALTKCQEALHWLQHRTQERLKRGVEGTTEK